MHTFLILTLFDLYDTTRMPFRFSQHDTQSPSWSSEREKPTNL